MPNNLMQIRHGQKNFHGKPVLRDIHLDIQSGDFITLLGASGSGKTTLLRLLAGLENWSSVETVSSTKDSNDSLPLNPAFVFQEPNLLGWRTVLENTLLPLELLPVELSPLDFGHTKTQAQERAIEVLKAVQLDTAAHKFPHELSGGMKMRASIARALITKPNLLFLDEPFAALDEPTREGLQEQLRGLWEKQHTTIVFVTHSLHEATFLANKVWFLNGQPSSLRLEHAINLPKYRTAETRNSLDYFNELAILRRLIQQAPTNDTASPLDPSGGAR